MEGSRLRVGYNGQTEDFHSDTNRGVDLTAMIRNSGILRSISLVVLTSFLWGTLSPVPWLGPRPARAFSVTDELEVGEKLLSLIRTEFKLLDDPDLTGYINSLGGEILQAAGPQYFNYHFFIVNNREFNAFAAPSGLIFIHSGLIEVMDSEDELVGVLAHEIAHAASRHISNRIARGSKVGIGTAALVIAGVALGGGALSQALVTGGMAAGASMNLKFSREDEEEADRLAFRYMQSQGRDPLALVTTMRKIRNKSRYRPSIPPYLLTHPEPELRMNYVQDLLLLDKGTYQQVDNFEFLRVRYRVLGLTGDPMSLLPLLRREAESDHAHPLTYYGLAQLHRATAEFSKAEEMLRRTMKAYPERLILLTDLGVLYHEAGRHQEALALFRQVREAGQDSAYNSYNEAVTLQHLGELEAAGRIFEELLSQLPTYSRLLFQLSRLRMAQGRSDEGLYYLGYYHWLGGEPEPAKRYLRQAASRLPAQHELATQAEDLLRKIERLEKL